MSHGGNRNVLQRQARGDPFVLTSNHNNMVDMVTQLGQLHFDPEAMVMMRSDGNGTTVVPRSNPAVEVWSFQYSKPAHNQCTVTGGTITLGGEDYDFTEDTVTLTGATEFVYVRATYGSTGSGVLGHASTRPVSNSTYFYLIIASFTATGGVWDEGIIRWRGDAPFPQPVI